MLRELRQHGDVTRLVLASPTSRVLGYTVSAYIAETAAGPRLIDTGFPWAWRALRRALTQRGGGDLARAVRGAVVTHQHEDHAGNVAALAALGGESLIGRLSRGDYSRAAFVRAVRRTRDV